MKHMVRVVKEVFGIVDDSGGQTCPVWLIVMCRLFTQISLAFKFGWGSLYSEALNCPEIVF